MAKDTYTVKRGDTLPLLRRTLKFSDGSVQDLTNATSISIIYSLNDGGKPAQSGQVVRAMTIVNPPGTDGIVEWSPNPADTVNAADYLAEIEVEFSSGKRLTFPNQDGHYIKFTVVEDVGDASALGLSGGGIPPLMQSIWYVHAATTAALPAFTKSDDVLTATANGALPSQDGVTLADGDLLLVKDEGAGTSVNNGVFGITQLGDGSNPWILTRAARNLQKGLLVHVPEGTTNAQTFFVLTTSDPIVLETTALLFQSALTY